MSHCYLNFAVSIITKHKYCISFKAVETCFKFYLVVFHTFQYIASTLGILKTNKVEKGAGGGQKYHKPLLLLTKACFPEKI